MCLLIQNLTMSLEEEEYDGTGDDEGSESDYSEGHVSQLRFLSGKKQKKDFEEVVNVSIKPPPPLLQNYEARDFRQLTQPDGKCHLSTSVATTSRLELDLNVDQCVLFGNSKSWARLELLCPIAVLENKAYTIDFGSAISGHLYCCLDQASNKSIIATSIINSHHILIDNRGLESNGKMKRELLKRGLHVGGVHGGEVHEEGHLKVGPLLPDDQD
ncbi:hypothetical protein GIB67_014811, partial [Kingdonia uniflora]